jgi:hypothetical protein
VVDQFRDPVMAHLMRRVVDRPKLAAAIANVDVRRDELSDLPDHAFAWPEKRAYPIHSAEHALLSMVYREDVDAVPAYVDRALKEACDVYGVNTALLTRPKIAAVQEPDYVFLLPQHRRLRVTEPAHVKVAEEKLRTEGSSLGVVSRTLAASRLVEKAAFFGVKLRPETQSIAGNVVTDTRTMTNWLEARREAAPIEYKDSYQKLAFAAKRLPAEFRDRAQQIKLAEALHELDEQAGLTRHYGRRLPDPMQTVFNTTKVASAGVTLAGQFMPLERLASFDQTFFSDALGPDFVREASDASGRMDPVRLAAVLETLPADMQRVLAAQMR